MKKTRILIADDHSVVRSGLRALLQRSPEYLVVGEATNGEEAVGCVERYKPDVVIMDISMPVLNGIEATSLMKSKNPDLKVIILTVHEDEEYIYQLLRAGANGYVLKSAGKKEIFAAIESARAGDRFFSPGVSRVILDGFIRKEINHQVVIAAPDTTPAIPLTRRELEVLTYIAEGFTNKRIAEALFLSIRTVNTHRTNLMQKLDIHETAGLVRYAIEHGMVRLKTAQTSTSAPGEPDQMPKKP